MSPSICAAVAADCIVRFVSQRVLGIPKKKKIFVGEKFRTFPFKTFHMEFNFVLSNRPKKVKARRDDQNACKPGQGSPQEFLPAGKKAGEACQ